jgi:hypothetical protein
MKINFTPCAMDAIHELQNNSELLAGMIEDAENFILDNTDTLTGSNELSFRAISHIKGLRSIRQLVAKLSAQQEGGEP